MPERIRIYGHRGAAAAVPENTVEGILHALEAGADGVEVDVRATADGALVLMHDADLSTTTDGRGLVEATTLEQVRRLDAGYHFAPAGVPAFRGRGARVPLVSEALDAIAGRGRAILEIKSSPEGLGSRAAALLAETLASRTGDDALVSSFDPRALATLRSLAPSVPTGLLLSAEFDPGAGVELARAGGHHECHVSVDRVDRATVARVHDAGMAILAWTVDAADRLRRLRELGADGVITNDPALAITILR